MGWLHALACFLPPSAAPVERLKDKDGEGEGGGDDEAVRVSIRGRGIVNGMAPFTRSKTQQQQREEDEKAEQRNRGSKVVEEKDRSKGRHSKRQRLKEEAGGMVRYVRLCYGRMDGWMDGRVYEFTCAYQRGVFA